MTMKKLLAILMCVTLLAGLLAVTASASETAGIVVTADKTDVMPGDTITYTVTLTNAAKVEGGVMNYEYYLNIPEGLTLVGSEVLDKTFMGATFNEDAKMGTAMGLIGAGYTGDDMDLVSFTCKVNDKVAGELTVSTFGVIITNMDGDGLDGETGSATVTSTVPESKPAAIVVTADKENVVPGDVITYTVSLEDAANVIGGVMNYEYYLNIPEGLTLVGSEVLDKTFMGATFNAAAKMGTAMGLIGAGYTGESLPLVSFTCEVNENVAGELTVSTFGVIITNMDGDALDGKTGSATVISTVPHVCDPQPVAEVPATCTAEGVKAHGKCACGKLYIDGQEVTEADLVIPMAEHEMGEFVETKAPTCTEKGEETAKCAHCDYVETREVEKIAHTEEIIPGKAATCTETGLTEGKKCSVCGEILVAQEEIPLAEHTFGEWEVTSAPTCTEKGVETATCTACGHTTTREVEALGHDFVDGICSVCGAEDPNPETMDTVLAVLAVTVIAGMGVVALTKKKEF